MANFEFQKMGSKNSLNLSRGTNRNGSPSDSEPCMPSLIHIREQEQHNNRMQCKGLFDLARQFTQK